ncbi:hypothetical protein [Xanthomonas sacchari]|uniref:hypothetical protein n=1 Tax=Xanthomonas sacchari TaxID=56458 RepID=UPI002434F788|nr:hypothetical protein [Xanthomonas sacchari]
MTTFAETPMLANLAPIGAMLPFPEISIWITSLDFLHVIGGLISSYSMHGVIWRFFCQQAAQERRCAPGQ